MGLQAGGRWRRRGCADLGVEDGGLSAPVRLPAQRSCRQGSWWALLGERLARWAQAQNWALLSWQQGTRRLGAAGGASVVEGGQARGTGFLSHSPPSAGGQGPGGPVSTGGQGCRTQGGDRERGGTGRGRAELAPAGGQLGRAQGP